MPGGTVRVVVGRNRQLGSGPRPTIIAAVGAAQGQVTVLLTVLLGVPVHFPALAVTRTWMVSRSVEVVSVVDVPVTPVLPRHSGQEAGRMA